ncbi:calcitonin/calcitonin-related polypeptide, alpha isoform X2 [Gouania willdenowi]|uniref:calcitonin/calcitonin-related polypeptide, alpha isoform X2 n=1 Tax=Gouania willdenowi TaxID=441366 RepID=UPI0010547823|nr:calcitonin-1-like isoform X2 [Gouania willdenowi]
MLKVWMLLLANGVMICQMYVTQAASFSSSKESVSDGVVLSNDDIPKLLTAIKEFMQLSSDEGAHQPAEGDSLNRGMSKRCTSLSTCVLSKLSQDIHKLQTYPRTDVGAQTPGKRRSLSEPYENYGSPFN